VSGQVRDGNTGRKQFADGLNLREIPNGVGSDDFLWGEMPV
jgi:hypothetical protein